MHARIRVSPPAERSAGWSRYAEHEGCAARGMPGVADVAARMRDDGRDEARNWRRLLDRYLEGWAEANPAKIFAATAHGYRFDDPFVGRFSRWSIPAYFERVRARFARAGASEERDFAFSIQGPMDGLSRRSRLTFFREAPSRGQRSRIHAACVVPRCATVTGSAASMKITGRNVSIWANGIRMPNACAA